MITDPLRADALCARLAERQHGCISLAQATALGMSEHAVFRLVRRGMWKRVLPGVYVIAGSENSWHQRLMAAHLWLEDESAISHAAAAALFKMPGFPPGSVELSTTRDRRSRAGIIVHRVKQLGPQEVGRRGEMRVTTATRTLIDLSATSSSECFEVAFHFSLHRKLTSLGRLRWAARCLPPGAPGSPRLREMLELYSENERPPESPLEVRVLRLLAKERLPPPIRQHPVVAAGRRYRIDLAYVGPRVAIEVDGYRWHSNRLSWDKDRTKLAALQAAGWQVVRATYDLATRNQSLLLAAIRKALRATLPLDGL
ncbi:MAG: type IV toxin-antitoxin system AbiEi family antitoxin domain-containing protein [Actinomycetota bacterium]